MKEQRKNTQKEVRKKQRKHKTMLQQYRILILLLILINIGIQLCHKNEDSKASSSIEKNSDTKSVIMQKIPKETNVAKQLYQKNQALLVLVNKANPIPSDYDAQLMSICNGRLQASSLLYEDLKAMLADADTAGGYSYLISSAYRSSKKQQKLVDEDVRTFMNQGMSYEEALEKTLEETQPAGYSEHQTGLALDILCSENMNLDISQADCKGNRWMRKNCYKYGFILRYPKEKEEITNISYEPWHFRYVGKETAAFLWENDLTLEEFYELITS